MKKQHAERLKDTLISEGYEAEIREDYSGRGMYGKATWGVTSDADHVSMGWCAGVAGVPLPFFDHMGLGTIAY